jgi:hypothetical protein
VSCDLQPSTCPASRQGLRQALISNPARVALSMAAAGRAVTRFTPDDHFPVVWSIRLRT